VAAGLQTRREQPEPGYRLNVSTMLRDAQDGHWHRPPSGWASALAKYLPGAGSREP